MAEYVAVSSANGVGVSGYRMKYHRKEFLELVDIARPNIIYRRKKNHFFAYDGFVMYSQECKDSDFNIKILNIMEFSNYQWET
jgi:hypothetical protein